MKAFNKTDNQTLVIIFVLVLTMATIVLCSGCAPDAPVTYIDAPESTQPVPPPPSPTPVVSCPNGGIVVTLNGSDELVCFGVNNKIKSNCKKDK